MRERERERERERIIIKTIINLDKYIYRVKMLTVKQKFFFSFEN